MCTSWRSGTSRSPIHFGQKQCNKRGMACRREEEHSVMAVKFRLGGSDHEEKSEGEIDDRKR